MGALAGLATQVLSAVTSQIGSYFDGAKGVLPPRQFVVPSTAFVLACIGLAMIVMGAGTPDAMWQEQPTSVKLLLTALLVIAFVVVTESSQNLAQLVRRLYSGTWPVRSEWQQILRRKHLRERLKRNAQALDLDHARDAYIELRRIIDIHARPEDPEDPPAVEATLEYPVLRSTLTPFRAVVSADLTWERLPTLSGAVTSAVELIGRYSVEPLPAHMPIHRDKLRTPPDPRFLGPGRTVFELAVTASLAPSYLQTGVIAGIQFRDGRSANDLLVLDRPSPTQLVLSVQDPDLSVVMLLDRTSLACFVVQPLTRPVGFAVVPTTTTQLTPGQLVTCDHVVWEARSIPPSAGQSQLTEERMASVAYWPRTDPDRTATLGPGGVLDSENVVEVRNPEWLDPGAAPRRIAIANSDAPPEEGDTVTLRFGRSIVARTCFVYEVLDNTSCYAAIRRDMALPEPLIATPLDRVPVANGPLEPSRLLGDQQLGWLERRRLRELPASSVVSRGDVRDHYVGGSTRLEAHRPIQRDRLVRAFPVGTVPLILRPDPHSTRIVRYEGDVPRYGDLVTVRLVRRARVIWEDSRLFVRRRASSCLIVMVPRPAIGDDPREMWQDAYTSAHVMTTHSDAQARADLRELRAQIQRESGLPDFNKALSDPDPSTEKFCAHVPALADLARKVHEQNSKLGERPWATSDGMGAADMQEQYRRMLCDLDSIAGMWMNLITRVRQNIERATLINLPRDASDVRPTALGNVLAASAAYPWRVYGIDTSTILPLLLTVLTGDEPAVQRFRAADATLDLLLLSSFWATIWSGLCMLACLMAGTLVSSSDRWIVPVLALAGLGFAWLMREAALAQAYGYGDAGKVLFDLHRHKVLTALGLVVDADLTAKDESEEYWQPLYHWFALGESDKALLFKTTDAEAASKPAANASASPVQKAADATPAASASASRNGVKV